MIPQLSVGDYLKTKRAMIRAVEKQALLSEKIDLLKEALAEGGVTSVASEGAQPKSVPSPGKCFSRNASLPLSLLGIPPLHERRHRLQPQASTSSIMWQDCSTHICCMSFRARHGQLGTKPRQALVTRHRHKVHFGGLSHSCLLSML